MLHEKCKSSTQSGLHTTCRAWNNARRVRSAELHAAVPQNCMLRGGNHSGFRDLPTRSRLKIRATFSDTRAQ